MAVGFIILTVALIAFCAYAFYKTWCKPDFRITTQYVQLSPVGLPVQ